MIATMPTFRQSVPFDTSSGDFVLRICGSSRNGQIVRLKSAKCTIGSGPQCTLRLRAAGVGPLHCLLLRGRAGAIVRCWSPDTRLNHQAFSDAVLSPGDRLGIGPIELEVLGVGATTAAERPKVEDGEVRRAAAERQRLAARLAKLETEQNTLESERNTLATERNALAAERQQWETQRNEMQQAANENGQQIADQLAKLETEQNALAAERREWEAERDEVQRTADDDCKQLAARLAKLELEQNTLAAERYTLGVEQNALNAEQNALNVERNALAADQNALAAERREWEAQRGKVQGVGDAEREQLTDEFAKLETEKKALAAERDALTAEQNALAAERKAMAEELRQWERQRAELAAQPESTRPETQESQESQVQPVAATSERAPVDLDDVFRRIGVKLDKAEDAEAAVAEAALTPGPSPRGRGEEFVPGPSPKGRGEESVPGPSPKTRGEESVPGPSPKTRGEEAVSGLSLNTRGEETVPPQSCEEEGEGNEESIDDYMDRLMQRIRSDSGDSAPAYKSTPRKATLEAAKAGPASVVESAEPRQAAPMSAAPTDFVPNGTRPRTIPPENRTDLSALRELANLSARSAIGHHARKVLIHTIYSKLAVAGVGLLAGVSLLWLWMRYGAREMTFYSALVAILVAIYWGVQYALLTGRLIIDKSGSIDLGRRDSSPEASPNDAPAAPKE